MVADTKINTSESKQINQDGSDDSLLEDIPELIEGTDEWLHRLYPHINKTMDELRFNTLPDLIHYIKISDGTYNYYDYINLSTAPLSNLSGLFTVAEQKDLWIQFGTELNDLTLQKNSNISIIERNICSNGFLALELDSYYGLSHLLVYPENIQISLCVNIEDNSIVYLFQNGNKQSDFRICFQEQPINYSVITKIKNNPNNIELRNELLNITVINKSPTKLITPQEFTDFFNSPSVILTKQDIELSLKQENDRLKAEIKSLNNERNVSNNIILSLKSKIRYNHITKDELRDIIDQNRTKSTDRANCTEIGKILGCNHETAKKCIANFGLSNYAKLK